MDEKRTLSEISHLFLSEVRQRQSGSATPRPVRVAPGARTEKPIDSIPDEIAASLEVENEQASPLGFEPSISAMRQQVSIVLASHLPEPSAHVASYARQLADRVGRVGVIEVDAHEFGITCFERGTEHPADPIILSELDERQISETLAELGFDVDCWLISLPNPKSMDARGLLRAATHWVFLSRADDEGVVNTYRALKGLAELGKPRLSLAVVDAKDEASAMTAFRKLDDASRRFLGCPMNNQPQVTAVRNVSEHLVLHCRSTSGKTSPQWKILSGLLASSAEPSEERPVEPRTETIRPSPMGETMKLTETNATSMPKTFSRPAMPVSAAPASDVIDLPGDGGDGSILEAVVRQGGADGMWVQCPLKAPMCPQAILAVGRDHCLILLAVAGKDITADLRSIIPALRWMTENRELIRMALPQLAIDASAEPLVRLLVDHADHSAELVQPLLAGTSVTIQAYRRLKWGQKTGLLLEAA